MVACLLAALAVASAEESHEDKQKGASAPADPLAGMDDPQTLSQLLQWSLANQDLDALHEKAEQIRKQGGAGGGAADGQSLDGLPLPEGGAPAAASILQKMTDQRKAELKEAMGQMMPDSALGEVRDALAGYMKRCEDAIEAAESRGQEDEDEQDGVGNCPELLPTAKGLERALKELEARQ